MKINFLLTIAILTIFLAGSFVSAEVKEANYGFYGEIDDNGKLVKTNTPINDFNALGFTCENDDCRTTTGKLWDGNVKNSGSNNVLNLEYPTELKDKGYGVFF